MVKGLFGALGLVLGLLVLIDIVWVVEAAAHLIWPNFVDNGA
jgi:hypothetical protein